MENRRVVITGLGALSPLGNDVASTWEGMKNGRSGVGPITSMDVSEYSTKIAGEVKDFDPKPFFKNPKDARRMDRYAHLPRAVMAYSTIVKGDGTYQGGVERPRIRVAFASRIPRKTCEAANIGYIDPGTIDPTEWMGKEEAGILCVEHAGEMLYRVSDQTAGT